MAIRYLSGINVDSNTLFVDDANNRVGIGTASPTFKLEVNGGLGAGVITSTSDSIEQIVVRLSSDNNKQLILGRTSTAARIFGVTQNVGYVPLLLNEAGGNVLIGTTTDAGYKLDVNGTGRFIGALSTNSVLLAGGAANIDSSLAVQVSSEGTGTQKWIGVNKNGSYGLIIGYNEISAGLSGIGAYIRQVTSDPMYFVVNNATTALTLASTGAATFSSSVTASSLIKSGGTSSQYLMADGSVSTLTNPVTGTGTTNYVPKWTSGSAIGNSQIFDNGTNVGIGTASPSGKFEVTGGGGSGGVQSYFSAYSGYTDPAAGNAAMPGGAKIVLWNDTATPQKATIGMDGSADIWFNNAGGQAGAGFTFYTGNGASSLPSARLKITKSGNVGIGTTAPSYILDVSGTARATTFLVTNATNTTGLYITSNAEASAGAVVRIDKAAADRQSYVSFDSDQLYFGIPASNTTLGEVGTKGSVDLRFATAYSERMRITAAGNVGIGTTAPASILHVSTTGANAYSSTITKGSNMKGIVNTLSNNADDMVGIYFATGGGTEGTHWSGITGSRSQNAVDWSTQLNFYTHNEDVANITDATQKMVIKGNGNVGIGTTSPATKLDVDGSINISNGNNLTWGGAYGAGIPTIASAINAGIYFYPAGSTSGATMRITSDGSVLIGTTTDAGYKLDVNGSFRTGANGMALNSSGFATTPNANTPWNAFRFSHPQNIIPNGDLESWTSGTSTAPDGYGGYDLGASTIITRESSVVKQGTYSAKILNPSGAAFSGMTYSLARVDKTPSSSATSEYTISFWHYAPTSNGSVSYIGIYSDTAAGYVVIQQLPTSSGWTFYSRTFSIRDDSNFEFYWWTSWGGGTANDVLYIDSVVLNKGTQLYDVTQSSVSRTGNATRWGDFYNLGGNVGIGTNAPSSGLVVATYGSKWDSDSQYNQPAGNIFSNLAICVADQENWIGLRGAYGSSTGSANLLLQANFRDVGSNAGHYVASQAISLGNADFVIGRIQTQTSVSTAPAKVEQLRIFQSGKLKLNLYGSGTFTGTPTYNLGVDASGNIIELPGGVVDGSGTANYVAKWQDANTVTNSQVFDNGTNVGINNATPKTKLDVNGTIGFGSKTMSMTDSFADALTVNMSRHNGCYVKITAFGDWSAHSTIAYMGEFFLQNGDGAYGEPGVIIRQVDNTPTDDVQAQIVDPAGTGTRDFVIQLKTTSASGTPFTAYIQYEVRGQYNSVS
jgi:hypothetical protein